MNLQFPIVPKLVALMVLFITLFAAAPVMAQTPPQQSGNIYAVADLVPEGAGSGDSVTGSTATFESIPDAGTRVTVVLQNMQPNSQFAIDIRDGSCSGPVLHVLAPVASDGSGSGTSVTNIPASVEFGRWHVAVRAVGNKSGAALLCGQANPALAGPPVSRPPGMPSTGQAIDLPVLVILWTGGAMSLALLGLVLRFKLEHHR